MPTFNKLRLQNFLVCKPHTGEDTEHRLTKDTEFQSEGGGGYLQLPETGIFLNPPPPTRQFETSKPNEKR